MSRSDYDYNCDGWQLIMWRGAVASAIRGKRGQAFLKEMLGALDALPEKKLIAYDLEANGQVCAIGAVGVSRGLDMARLDPEDSDSVAKAFGIASALTREIVWENDEVVWGKETPEQRYHRMRQWVASNISHNVR